MKTISASPKLINRKWYVVDAESQVIGRLASRVALILRGKHKPIFTPHVDTGDCVVVVNAEKARFTGDKWRSKNYYHHTGYPGGLKTRTAAELKKLHPTRLFRLAVKGMLPKNRLGNAMIKKLHVYAGPEHRHHAQRPEPLTGLVREKKT